MIHVDMKSAPAEETKHDFVVLTTSNALSMTLGSTYCKERLLINRRDCWHKFMILGGSMHDMEFILKLIMDTVYPVELVPIMYSEEGEHTSFLAQRCGPAIERLCRSNLVVNIPNGPCLELQIVLGFAHVKDVRLNANEILLNVIQKRFNSKTKYLDLSNFHRDPDLCDVVFCPLSQAKILTHVLNAVKSTHKLVTSINLSHNDLSSLRSLEALWIIQTLVKLDLRHNMVKTMKDLEVLRPVQLSELLLDQNPLCQFYSDEHPYISAVRGILPSLLKLDGVVLGPPGFPRSRRNFLMPPEECNLADQFIRHYFTLYDSDSRMKLEGLYHRDALFSLTSTYLPAQTTSNTARLTEYTIESRNLLKLSDYTKNLKLLYQGSDAILATICRLPRSEHDPYSFAVDFVHSALGIVISVTGVFREPAVIKSPLIRSFSRVFVLVQIGPRDFQIANETVHVKNATTKEAEVAFKIPKPSVGPNVASRKPEKMSDSDKEQMTNILSQLTEMNSKWCRKTGAIIGHYAAVDVVRSGARSPALMWNLRDRVALSGQHLWSLYSSVAVSRCLEESKWDVKKALTVFTELYKLSKIPPEAFYSL